MTVQDLIKQYEEEMLFLEERIDFNLKHKEISIAQTQYHRQITLREVVSDLKNLLV